MPIYEYICMDCDKKFDVIRRIADADKPVDCVECASQRTIRQLSVFFAQSAGKVVAGGGNGGCGGCSGGSCSSCSH
jgi:putative FmdB family regulatory protein